jgi:hypothetical protein
MMLSMLELESVGFQLLSLRQCFLDKQPFPLRRATRKPNIGGLFAPNLLTGLGAGKGQMALSQAPSSPKLLTVEFSTLLLSH